jgi:hypothetical protein
MTPDEKMGLEEMRAAAMTRQGDVAEKEDELYETAAPKGRFSGKALNSLVDATNRLLPIFGITEAYPKFGGETQTSLPVAFMRLLTMFGKAIEDAIAEGVLPEDANIDLTVVTDDAGLQGLAGRIGMAAKSPGLKRFLKRKVSAGGEEEMGGEESPESEMPEEEDDMSESKMNTLFAERM